MIFFSKYFIFAKQFILFKKGEIMGKGDLRTRRGKIYRGTFGKTRPKKKIIKVVKEKSNTISKKK